MMQFLLFPFIKFLSHGSLHRPNDHIIILVSGMNLSAAGVHMINFKNLTRLPWSILYTRPAIFHFITSLRNAVYATMQYVRSGSARWFRNDGWNKRRFFLT